MSKLIVAKSNRGAPDPIGLHDSGGTIINPATVEKLDELKTLLTNIYSAVDELEIKADTINLNTDTLEAKIQSVRDQLDVLLSTRASESTLVEIKGYVDDIETELTNILNKLDVDLSTRASENTLVEVRDYLDTVETKLQTIIDKLQSILVFPGLAIKKELLNGSSPDLNVNGSVTPVDFSIAPSVGKIWYIHSLTIVIEDIGINFTKFGGITALTNGVDFKLKENGLSEVTLANIKYNGEFYTFANDIILESSTTDIFVAHIKIKENTGTVIKLVNSNGDYIKVTVNDNLTAINKFRAIIRGYEVDE